MVHPPQRLLLLTHLLVFFLSSSVTCFSPSSPKGYGRLYLDSADFDEWDSLLKTGAFYGITTNPVLLERCNQPCTVQNLHYMAKKALERTEEFFCQAWGTTADEIYDRALLLSQPDRERITIKIPVTKEGVIAANRLRKEAGVRICLTGCFSSKQALVACAIGAEYIAPHWERITAAGAGDGYSETLAIKDIIDNFGNGQTRVLVASILNAKSMARMAADGLDNFAMPTFVAEDLFVDPFTEGRAKEFERAAIRGGGLLTTTDEEKFRLFLPNSDANTNTTRVV